MKWKRNLSELCKNMKPLVILTGPTAVGKTELSIELARTIGGEIISADSMQVYKGMDIGSAKIKQEEMKGVPHHLIDIYSPEQDFNVVAFKQLALEAMEGIYSRGHIPVVVGGTGFYIQALLYDIDFTENGEEKSFRKQLEAEAKEHGCHALHERLRKVDPVSAELIHENNIKRVIRALEFFEETGTPISEHNAKEHEKESPYRFCYFVLNDDRQRLYERIDKRVDMMLVEGLIEEVSRLKEAGYNRSLVSMQGLGYKEIISYLEGEISLEEAVYLIKRDTRHFAKRQLTWFRREKEVLWVDKQAFSYDNHALMQYMLRMLKEKGIYE